MFGGASLCFGQTETTCPVQTIAREGTSRWSIYCITTIISNQIKKQKIMDNEKRKNNVKGNRRERANKGGRPVQRSHRETEIPCYGENGNRGLLPIEIQSKVSRCFCQ